MVSCIFRKSHISNIQLLLAKEDSGNRRLSRTLWRGKRRQKGGDKQWQYRPSMEKVVFYSFIWVATVWTGCCVFDIYSFKVTVQGLCLVLRRKIMVWSSLFSFFIIICFGLFMWDTWVCPFLCFSTYKAMPTGSKGHKLQQMVWQLTIWKDR